MADAMIETPDAKSIAVARRQRLIGIALMCGALVCFSGLDTIAKVLGQSLDPLQVTWARYASNVFVIALVLNPWTKPGLMRTTRPWLQASRSVLLLLSTVLNFFALQHLQLVQALAILFATPLVVALLAGPMLGERVGPRRLVAIATGFAGVLVITRPGLDAIHPAALYSVGACICYALYSISTRILSTHDSTATTLFYSGIAGLVLMTPVMPLVWTWPQTPGIWVMMLAIGIFAAVGHWLLIMAHALAPAAVLSPFIYTQIIWMLASGYLIFGDLPDGPTMAGAGIVIASGLYLLWRERSDPTS